MFRYVAKMFLKKWQKGSKIYLTRQKELTLKVELEMTGSKNDMEKMFKWTYQKLIDALI